MYQIKARPIVWSAKNDKEIVDIRLPITGPVLPLVSHFEQVGYKPACLGFAIGSIMGKHDVIHKNRSTYRIAAKDGLGQGLHAQNIL